jgi:hypothetical protein
VQSGIVLQAHLDGATATAGSEIHRFILSRALIRAAISPHSKGSARLTHFEAPSEWQRISGARRVRFQTAPGAHSEAVRYNCPRVGGTFSGDGTRLRPLFFDLADEGESDDAIAE